MKLSAIYSIVHRESGRCYIGSSSDCDWRFYQHRWNLNRGTHSNRRLQRAWKKYGPESFEWTVVETCDVDKLIEREQWHLDRCQPHVYNVGIFVEAVTRGVPVPESVRRKLSATHKKRTLTPEHLAAMTAANKARAGWKHTDEAKRCVSEANRGRTRSEAHREAIRRAQMGNTHRLGKKQPTDAVEKTRLANLGRKRSPEAIANLCAGRRRYLARIRGEAA